MHTLSLDPPVADSASATDTVGKVASATAAFWVMKGLATTLGEPAGHSLSMTLGLGNSVGFAVTVSLLLVVLFAQIRSEQDHASLFWTAVSATTTGGTEVSDLADGSLGLGYVWGSVNPAGRAVRAQSRADRRDRTRGSHA